MRLNFTPFVDLFSILAIGLLVIMAATSGIDVVVEEDEDVAIVRFYLGAVERGGTTTMAQIVDVEPYYLRGGVEVPRGSLGVFVEENDSPDSVEVVIRGAERGLSDLMVRFRIARILDPNVLYEVFQTQIVGIRGRQVRSECPQRLGAWRDPGVRVALGQSWLLCSPEENDE